MKYEDIVNTYIKIESTSKRLEMTDHLIELILSTPPKLLDKVLYLTQGKLYPDFMGIELGIADKLALKAISVGTGIKEPEVNQAMLELGDLGLVAEKMVANKKQMALFEEELDVDKAFDSFDKITRAAGSGSQELKQKLVAELLHDATPPEAKYIIRTLAGKLRLGIADMTILDALAYAFTSTYPERLDRSIKLIDSFKTTTFNDDARTLSGSISASSDRRTVTLYEAIDRAERFYRTLKKNKAGDDVERMEGLKGNAEKIVNELKSLKEDVERNRDRIENAYNLSSDLGEVVRVLTGDGIKGLDRITIKPGVPLRAMLAERLPSLEEIFEKLGGDCAFEYKYDGLRIQAHITDEVQLFSRRLENITDQFPDVQQHLREAFKGRNAVVEGECVPVDVNTGEMLPFQIVSQRRGRKHDLEQTVEDVPVVLFLFDVLYTDGEDYISRPFPERREKLSEIFQETDHIKLSHILFTSNQEAAEDFFQESLGNGTEGLIAKAVGPDSYYRAGSRGWQWIKYKREYKAEMTDSVDLVVVGAFAGRGRRAGVYGALLMAAYNQDNDEFETVCKVGTGFSDEVLAKIPQMLKPNLIDHMHPRVKSEMKADYWFTPALVMEIVGAEITHSPIHTCAYGILKNKAGLAIRFPRFTGNWRMDKQAEDATSSDEIVGFYKQQLKQVEN